MELIDSDVVPTIDEVVICPHTRPVVESVGLLNYNGMFQLLQLANCMSPSRAFDVIAHRATADVICNEQDFGSYSGIWSVIVGDHT